MAVAHLEEPCDGVSVLLRDDTKSKLKGPSETRFGQEDDANPVVAVTLIVETVSDHDRDGETATVLSNRESNKTTVELLFCICL